MFHTANQTLLLRDLHLFWVGKNDPDPFLCLVDVRCLNHFPEEVAERVAQRLFMFSSHGAWTHYLEISVGALHLSAFSTASNLETG